MKNAALFLVRRGVKGSASELAAYGLESGLGEGGGARADGGPMGLGDGRADVLDAFGAEEGAEGAGGGE